MSIDVVLIPAAAAIARLEIRGFVPINCIITFNSEETANIDGVTVEVIPAWKWLLGE